MARSIDPKATFEFVLPGDQALPDDDPLRTVWTLRTLSARERATIQDMAAFMRDNELGVRTGTLTLETLRHGLVDVRNFVDGEGNPIRVERVRGRSGTELVSDGFIGRIHPRDQATLTNAITEAGHLDEEAAGKS
jgi:hypothetical protein